MNNNFEKNIIVVYTGDETKEREKQYGSTIMNQLFVSCASIRENWSADVEILFIHTKPLTDKSKHILKKLGVNSIQSRRGISDEYLIANKYLVGENYKGKKDILCLDCDTIVHQPIAFDTFSNDVLVALDSLQDISESEYKKLYSFFGIKMPKGKFTSTPSYEYYYHNKKDIFPLLNVGVYFIKNRHKDIFYKKIEENFLKILHFFKNEKKDPFYSGQVCFALTLHQLGLNYGYFPKGYNFICTKRAPHLIDWPKDKIFIEHYAGDNSHPLVFNKNTIDPVKSRIKS